MARFRFATLLGLVGLGASCVPADEALGLGSVEFTFAASQRTRDGVIADESGGFAIKFDRVVLSFKTMTIGKVGVSDTCAYRGRGAITNVVFDPRDPIVQTFNGIKPIDCPDVGLIFGAPDSATTLGGTGKRIASADLIELAEGGAEAIIQATATKTSIVDGGPTKVIHKIDLRFDASRTSSRFGGCRGSARGVRILANQRDLVTVRFAAEVFFRDAISQEARLRVQPFIDADDSRTSANGNGDGITTMEELDKYPLTSIREGAYQLPNGRRAGVSFGDYIRAQYRFSIFFRTEEGLCVGNEPGVDETTVDAGGP